MHGSEPPPTKRMDFDRRYRIHILFYSKHRPYPQTGPYEIAEYCIENNVDTLVLLCAWLRSTYFDELGVDQPSDTNTLNYWIARLRPLWHAGTDKYTVIICNRTGTERGQFCVLMFKFYDSIDNVMGTGSTFAGTSTVLRSRSDRQLPRILTMMGKEEEGALVVDIPQPGKTELTEGAQGIMSFRA